MLESDSYEPLVFAVSKSGIVDSLLSWANFKQSKYLKKSDGTKTEKIHGIEKLDNANKAGGKESDKCTLILTEGDSAKALAVSCCHCAEYFSIKVSSIGFLFVWFLTLFILIQLAGLAAVGRDYYCVFPLRGKLLNVREATAKQLTENKEIGYIKQTLGLQQHKDTTV